jgi:hypothetical protein
MKKLATGAPILALVPLLTCVAFAACASSGEEAENKLDGGGDAASPSTPDAADVERIDASTRDAADLRCSRGFCIVDLPSAGAYGFTKWLFNGVQADPEIGVWAIATGDPALDDATAQLLRFEKGAWKPTYAPALGSGIGKRNVRLTSLASDGAGHLMAIGSTIDDGTTVIVRGDGTTFTTTPFDGTASAVWFAGPDEAWAVGSGGSIYRSLADGSWASESNELGGDFYSVWGSGSGDVYVGGVGPDYYYGYVGHRTIEDGGARWSFRSFEPEQMWLYGNHTIWSGIAMPDGPRFWAAESMFGRGASDGGEVDWTADPFVPRVTVRSFWARANDDIWAVGHVGSIFHFDGTAWKNALLEFNGAPLTSHLKAVTGTNAGEVFIVGEGISLWRQAK